MIGPDWEFGEEGNQILSEAVLAGLQALDSYRLDSPRSGTISSGSADCFFTDLIFA